MAKREYLTRSQRVAALHAGFWLYLVAKYPYAPASLKLDPIPAKGKVLQSTIFWDYSPALTLAGPHGIMVADESKGGRRKRVFDHESFLTGEAKRYGGFPYYPYDARSEIWQQLRDTFDNNLPCFKELFRRILAGEGMDAEKASEIYQRKRREKSQREKSKERKSSGPTEQGKD